MGKFRVSVTGLMAVVALFGLEFVALRAGTHLWFSTVYTLTALLLLFAVVAARYGRRDARAFWFGFAVFGWVYFVQALGFGGRVPFRVTGNGELPRSPLLTMRLVDSSLYLIRGDAPVESEDGFESNKRQLSDGITLFGECTTAIAHLMVTLAAALLGGLVAVVLKERRARPVTGGGATGHGPQNSNRVSLPLLLLMAFLGVSALAGSAAYVNARPLGPHFPPLAFHKEEDRNDFTVDWYSKHLEAMREPSLWALSRADPGATAYRFLWLPSFDHAACVRVVKTGGGATLRFVVLDGLGGYEPGQIAVNRTVSLSQAQWEDLDRRFKHLNFWALPTKLDDDGGSDGDESILEGVGGGKYHITDRWEPEPEYLELCLHLVDLSGSRALRKALLGYHTVTPEPASPAKVSGSGMGSGFR